MRPKGSTSLSGRCGRRAGRGPAPTGDGTACARWVVPHAPVRQAQGRLDTNGGAGSCEVLVRLGCQGWRVALDLPGCSWVPAGDAEMTAWGRSEGRELRSERRRGRGEEEEKARSPFDKLRAGSRGTFGMTREGGWVGDSVLTGDPCAARGWLRGRGRFETRPVRKMGMRGVVAASGDVVRHGPVGTPARLTTRRFRGWPGPEEAGWKPAGTQERRRTPGWRGEEDWVGCRGFGCASRRVRVHRPAPTKDGLDGVDFDTGCRWLHRPGSPRTLGMTVRRWGVKGWRG